MAFDDDLRRLRVLPSFGKLSGGAARMSAPRRATFAAAHRMGDRVHCHAAHVRTMSLPTLAAGFADDDIHVLRIADHADRRAARARQSPNFARGQRDLCPATFAGVNDGRSGAAAQLSAATRPHFDVVNRPSRRDVAERQAIPDVGLRVGAADDRVAGRQTLRSQDVAFFAVGIMQQGDATLRFGSYSMAATRAGTASLSRLKSITRYIRL